MSQGPVTTTIVEGVRVVPPTVVSGLTLLGVSLNEWILMGTGVYLLLSLFVLIRDKFWRDRYGRK